MFSKSVEGSGFRESLLDASTGAHTRNRARPVSEAEIEVEAHARVIKSKGIVVLRKRKGRPVRVG